MLSPKRLLAAAIVAFCIGNIVVTFLRSGIPYELDGRVDEIEIVNEKVAGLDDVWIVHIGDRAIHLDNGLAAQLRVGDQIDKPAWSTSIDIVDREDVRLGPSRDMWGMVPALLLLAASVVVVESQRGARRAPL